MDFLSKNEKVLEKEFIDQGYIIREAANKDALNKIQKLIWFEMAKQVTGIEVSRICCNNKPINLTVYNVGDSKSSVLLCTSHSKQKYFLKDIFEVRLLDEKLVNSHTM